MDSPKKTKFKKVRDAAIAISSIVIIFIFGQNALYKAGISPEEFSEILRRHAHWAGGFFGIAFLLSSFKKRINFVYLGIAILLILGSFSRWVILTRPIPGMTWDRGLHQMVWIPSGTISFTNSQGVKESITNKHGFWIDQSESSIPGARSGRRNRRGTEIGQSWTEAQRQAQNITKNSKNAGQLPNNFFYRLPTVHEWIYACAYNKMKSEGDPIEIIFQDGSRRGPQHRSRLENNALNNMQGNVWEWCLDRGESPLPHFSSNEKYRIVIGGGWTSPMELCSMDSQLSFREKDKFKFVGYRFVLSRIESPLDN